MKELPWNDNLPHGIPDPADMEEPKMKVCPECGHKAPGEQHTLCETCRGEGEIEMTQEEVEQENDERKEEIALRYQ